MRATVHVLSDVLMPQPTYPTEFGQLASVMRTLYITELPQSEDWLRDCLASDSAVDVRLECVHLEAAMTRLREEAYDVILLHHAPRLLDAIATIGTLRAVGADYQAVLVLGDAPTHEMTAVCLEASADAYVCLGSTEVRTLLWQMSRACEYQQLLRTHHQLQQNESQQRSQHYRDAIHQLRAQRSLLIDHLGVESNADASPPNWLTDHFRDLLRIHVVTGSGNLKSEVAELVDRLVGAEVTLAEALMAHTVAVEELVQSLGTRSSWHVIGRGNLLAYELVLRLLPTGERVPTPESRP